MRAFKPDDLVDMTIAFAILYVGALFPSPLTVVAAFAIGAWFMRQLILREERGMIQRVVRPLPSPSVEGSGEDRA